MRRRMDQWRKALQKQTQPQAPGPGTTQKRPRRQRVKDFFQVKKRPQDKVRRKLLPPSRKLDFPSRAMATA